MSMSVCIKHMEQVELARKSVPIKISYKKIGVVVAANYMIRLPGSGAA